MSDDQGSANPNIAQQLLENNEVFSELESDSADASNPASPAVTPE